MNLSPKKCEELKIPYNPFTGNQYTNNNLVLLAAYTAEHYTSPQWAGYQQWLKLGRVVRKGESGTRILMIKSKKLVDKNGADYTKQYPSSVTVFNFEQTEALAEVTTEPLGAVKTEPLGEVTTMSLEEAQQNQHGVKTNA